MSNLVFDTLINAESDLTGLIKTLRLAQCISQTGSQYDYLVNDIVSELIFFYRFNQKDRKIAEAFMLLVPALKRVSLSMPNVQMLFVGLSRSHGNASVMEKVIFELRRDPRVMAEILSRMNNNKYNSEQYGNIDKVLELFLENTLDQETVFLALDVIDECNYQSDDIQKLLQHILLTTAGLATRFISTHDDNITWPCTIDSKEDKIQRLLKRELDVRGFLVLLKYYISGGYYNYDLRDTLKTNLRRAVRRHPSWLRSVRSVITPQIGVGKTAHYDCVKCIELMLSKKGVLVEQKWLLPWLFKYFNWRMIDGRQPHASSIQERILINLRGHAIPGVKYKRKLSRIAFSEKYNAKVRRESIILLLRNGELLDRCSLEKLYHCFSDAGVDVKFRMKLVDILCYINSKLTDRLQLLDYVNLEPLIKNEALERELRQEVTLRLAYYNKESPVAVNSLFGIFLRTNELEIQRSILIALQYCEILTVEQLSNLERILKEEEEDSRLKRIIAEFFIVSKAVSRRKSISILMYVLNKDVDRASSDLEYWHKKRKLKIEDLSLIFRSTSSSTRCKANIYKWLIGEDLSQLNRDVIERIISSVHSYCECLSIKGKIIANIPNYEPWYIEQVILLLKQSFHEDGGYIDDQGRIGKFVEEIVAYFDKLREIPNCYCSELVSFVENTNVDVWARRTIARNLFKVMNLSREMVIKIMVLFRNTTIHPTVKEGLVESMVFMCANNSLVFIAFYFEFYLKKFTKLKAHRNYYSEYDSEEKYLDRWSREYVIYFRMLASRMDMEILFKISDEYEIDLSEFIFLNALTNRVALFYENKKVLFYNRKHQKQSASLSLQHIDLLLSAFDAIKNRKEIVIVNAQELESKVPPALANELEFVCIGGLVRSYGCHCGENCWEITNQSHYPEKTSYKYKEWFRCKKCGASEVDERF